MSEQPFIHRCALVEAGATIGRGTRVWAYAHILPGAQIGEECNICDHTFIENEVIIGNRVTIKCGVQVWDGVTLEDDVFVGPNATFTNDSFPRSKCHLEQHPRTIVKTGASIGANSTILPGLAVGQNAMVGAGAVVTKDVPPNAIVVGNPAYIKGYVASGSKEAKNVVEGLGHDPPTILPVGHATLYRMPLISDLRGCLSFGELNRHVPFPFKRYFVIFNVPNRKVRGEHAHRNLHQFLICIKGSCAAYIDDGKNRLSLTLDRPDAGLYLPPMIWAAQYDYSADAVLLVLASEVYDANDYIRDYDEFLMLAKDRAKQG